MDTMTLRPRSQPTVLALRMEKAGKLKWRAGQFLVVEGGTPRVMKPADVEAQYEAAGGGNEMGEPAAAPRKRRGGRRPAATRTPRAPRTAAPVRAPERPTPTPAPGKRRPRLMATPEQMAEAKRLIEEEGLNIRDTANKLGMTDDTGYRRVWGWAKANGWESSK